MDKKSNILFLISNCIPKELARRKPTICQVLCHKLGVNGPQIYAVADCGLRSYRNAPRLKRRSWLHNPSEKRQLTYILLLPTVVNCQVYL